MPFNRTGRARVPWGLLLGSSLALLPLPTALGQGHFQFVTGLSAPFGGMALAAAVFDRDGATLLVGRRYSAQFYAGPAGTADDQLQPVGTPRTFAPENLLASGGYFPAGPDVVVPGVPAGATARLQLRAWDNELGARAGWSDAVLRASSAAFDCGPLRDGTPKGGTAIPSGLRSFQLPAGTPPSAPAQANFVTAYSNYHYYDPFGGFIPEVTVPRGFSGDGRAVLVDYTPSNPAQVMAAPRLLRYAPDAASVVVEPAIPAGLGDGGWEVVGISADAAVLLGTRLSPKDGLRHGYVVHGGVADETAVLRPLSLSGNARFVFGLDAAGDLVREDRFGGPMVVVVDHTAVPREVGKVSDDGSAAVVDGKAWTLSAGVLPPLPREFVALSVSGDGRTFVGHADRSALVKPAYWTRAGGLVVLHDGVPGVSGLLRDASFDGSVLVGRATTPDGPLHVWDRDGVGHALHELLPNGAASGLKNRNGLEVTRVSHDGRTLCGTANLDFVPDGRSVTPYDFGWVATIAFPGVAPKLAMTAGPGGRFTLRAPSAKGYRYHFEKAVQFDAWSPLTTVADGTGGDLVVEVEGAGSNAMFRMVADP